jgi:hypothetical protein
MNYEETFEYRRLFHAVLFLAIKEAASIRSQNGKEVAATRKALEWINGDSDMLNVCLYLSNTTKQKALEKVAELKDLSKEKSKRRKKHE